MSIGKEIRRIREEQKLTQAELAARFHVARQTVSSWENEKSYPDLQTLVGMSDAFGVSLDRLLKEDAELVQAIDREWARGSLRREKKWVDFFTGAGTGLLLSCLFSPDSPRRTAVILVGLAMLATGLYKQARYEKKIEAALDREA